MITGFIKNAIVNLIGDFDFEDFPCATTDRAGAIIKSNEPFKRYISDELGLRLGELTEIRGVDGVAFCIVKGRTWIIKHKKVFRDRYQILLLPKISEFPEISDILELPMLFIDSEGIIRYRNKLAFEKFRFRARDYFSKYCMEFSLSMLSSGLNLDLDFSNNKCRVSFYRGLNNLWLVCIRDAKDSRSLDKSKDQRTLSIVHDFRNILSLIDMNCQMFQESGGKSKEVEQIRDTIKNSSKMIQDILQVNRSKVESCCISNLLFSMEKIIKKLLGEKINLSLNLEETLGQTMISEVDLERMILNLVLNAKDAMNEVGSLEISLLKRHFPDSWSMNGFQMLAGFYLLLRFEDTGIGISPENQRRIFQPMFTTKENGSGLGLSTIASILKDIGGAIEVFSKPEKGSRFDLYMPLTESLEETVSKKRILLVEDNRQFLDMCSSILHREGYEVKKFLDAENALNYLKKNAIDLLITDANLPGISGADLAYRAQVDRILVISGYEESILRKKFPANAEFMLKPIRMDELREKVKLVLSK